MYGLLGLTIPSPFFHLLQGLYRLRPSLCTEQGSIGHRAQLQGGARGGLIWSRCQGGKQSMGIDASLLGISRCNDESKFIDRHFMAKKAMIVPHFRSIL